jgi:hypothetical protein
MKVFWSWQDDSPSKTNRYFIKEALEEAINALEGEFELDDADRPALDHDTKGIPGAAEIVPVIMEKIAASAIFVADVTPVARTTDGKAIPNPNVLVELGWSLNKPGWARQIYVLNTADGWKISDLPFDIRGRRTLTYELSDSADTKTKSLIKKALVKSLTEAIRTNLEHYLEEVASETPIVGIKAREGTPSIWAGEIDGFIHQDSFGDGHLTTVSITPGPRAYLRIIPSGWKTQPPDVASIGALDRNVAPDAYPLYTAGDSGATKEGYVRYWISSDSDKPRTSKDAVMYFEDTGEFWVLHGSCVAETMGLKQKVVDLSHVFRGWANALRRGHWVLDHFGAFAARRVEVGFTGFEGVRFPGNRQSIQTPARRESLKYEQKERDWSSPQTQETFLIEALAQVYNLFGKARLTLPEAQKFILANDPERARTNPFSPLGR